ncbi:MAG: putative metallo-hydrolase YflN [Candidatus Heimdallarchaeota archaeon LC_3]|nr:MAG: putative metallo-hydrolase YflN [Candidatus Heimdallarchaeota archaeon LC_3]
MQFYQISLSLPFKPHKVHSYIFRDENDPDEILMLDSGVNQLETLVELEECLKKLDSNLGIESIKYLIPTHAHIDHIGALDLIKEHSGAKILIHKEEYKFFYEERSIFWVDEVFTTLGVPTKYIETFHYFLNYYQEYNRDFTPDITLEDDSGDIPEFNGLKYIKIPGHTPHHIAIVLEEQKAIFTGDTLLSRITPNLGFSGKYSNPVKEYLSTLNKLSKEHNNWTVYPAHQEIISNIKERAEMLLFLLEERLENVKTFFQENGNGLPSLIKSLYPSVWQDPVQRFLAIMETHSYIKFFYGNSSPFKPPYEMWK